MALSIESIYKDVQFQVHKDNGTITFSDFNRMSIRAENRLQEFLTGGFVLADPNQAYITQRSKDILSPFIVKHKTMLDGEGQFVIPTNYHSYENMYALDMQVSGDCSDEESSCNEEEEEKPIINKIPIDLLDGQEFYYRVNTDIKGLKPSKSKPIAKQLNGYFEVYPKNIQAVTLEYVRMPIYGQIVPMIDPIYNEEVVNPTLTRNYEWNESARELLIYFITDFYSNHLRETAMKQFNEATGKTVTK